MKTKLCGVYSIYCLGNGKRYIGISGDIEKRWSTHVIKLRGSRHGNPHLQAAWNKYGSESFEFMVLQEVPVLLLDVHEVAWIERYNAMNRNHGFNLREGGEHPIPSNETRAKLRASHLGKKRGPISDETRAKLSAAATGRKIGTFSATHRAKMSAAATGHKRKPFSASHIANMSAAQKGKKHSLESKSKMSAAQKGKIVSAETRAKMSAAKRRMSQATKDKMSESQRARYAQKITGNSDTFKGGEE